MVECSDNGMESISIESQKCVIKEDHNVVPCDIKDDKGDADQALLVMNDEYGRTASNINCSTNDNEKEITDFVAPIPSSHCSLKLQSLEEDLAFHPDKSVMELDLLEMTDCYEKNTYHVIKDIRIDDGVPKLNKEHCDSNSSNESAIEAKEQSIQRLNGDENVIEEAISGKSPSVSAFKESDHSQEKAILEIPAMNSAAVECGFGCKEAVLNVGMISRVEKTENGCDSAKVSFHAPDVVPKESTKRTTDELSYDSKLEPGSITFDFDPSASTASKEQGSHQNIVSEPSETQNLLRLQDSDTKPMSGQLQYSQGESSFSAAGPLSGLITHSGSIAYSGSLSHRSDSSSTSTHSFAFPILRSEWNCSPVRMGKADKRLVRKYKGWKKSFICCKF